MARQSSVVKRRIYSVPYPNTMWHIDGNHKLIKWGFVVYAGVDGFSRLIAYVKCSTNNQATTACTSFKEGVTAFGIPEKVRTDHGGENIVSWKRYVMCYYW